MSRTTCVARRVALLAVVGGTVAALVAGGSALVLAGPDADPLHGSVRLTERSTAPAPDVDQQTVPVDGGPLLEPAPGVPGTEGLDGDEVGAASGGASSHYGFLSRQGSSKAPIARWNPCGGVIGYRVSSAGGGKGATADVKAAMARIRTATGLPLVYRGQTKVIPGRGKATYPDDTRIVVAWTKPGRSRYLPKPPKGRLAAAGYGGGAWVGARDARGGRAAMFVSGFVVLNASYRLAPGFGTGPRYGWQGTRGQLLMHELGHAVGLDHTADRKQIMYPTLTRKKAAWGKGDLKGLSYLGRSRGCLRQG